MENKNYPEMLGRFIEIAEIAFNNSQTIVDLINENPTAEEINIYDEEDLHIVTAGNFGIVKNISDNGDFKGYNLFSLDKDGGYNDYKDLIVSADFDEVAVWVCLLKFWEKLVKDVFCTKEVKYSNVIQFPIRNKNV